MNLEIKRRIPVKKRIINISIFTIMALFSISFLYPFFYMLINALKSSTDFYIAPFSLPKAPLQWNNFTIMISQFKIFNFFKNTGIIIVLTQILVIFAAICSSFTFAKLQFKGKKLLYLLVIASITIPNQVMIIPMYVMFGRLKLMGGFWSVVLAYLGIYLPSNTILMTSFFKGIPNELIESARLDGCGYLRTIRYIAVPVGMPIVVMNFILNAIYIWNDLLIPMVFLHDEKVKTVMVALSGLQTRYHSEPTFQFTGLLLSVIPILIVFVGFQKQIINGILMGSTK